MPRERQKPRRSISIDADLVERVREEAYKRVVGPSLLVDRFVRAGLDRLAPLEDEDRVAVALLVDDPQRFGKDHRERTGHAMAVIDGQRASCAECDFDVVRRHQEEDDRGGT